MGSQIDVFGALSNALSGIADFIPKLLLFLVILLVGWVIARLLRAGIGKLLQRVGFEKLAERAGLQRMLAASTYTASGLIAGLVYYAVMLMALQLGFGVFGPNPISVLLTDIVSWIPRAVVAVVIVVVAAAVGRVVRDLLQPVLIRFELGGIAARAVQYFIISLGVIAALNQIGVAALVTTPVLVAVLAAVAGIAVVGVGGGLIRPMQERWEALLSGTGAGAGAGAANKPPAPRARHDASTSRSAGPGESGSPTPGGPVTGRHIAEDHTTPIQFTQPPQGTPPRGTDAEGRRP